MQSSGRNGGAATTPLVSVVMPVHNTPLELIDLAIASALEQETRCGVELVICDDGSSRRTRAGLQDMVDEWRRRTPALRIVLVRHEVRQGPAAARNSAVSQARGTYLLWLDSDDELLAGAIDALVDVAVKTKAEMVIGRCSVTDATGQTLRDPETYVRLARKHGGSMHDPLAQVIFSVQPQLVSAQAFSKAGGFDEEYRLAEVSEFFLRFVGKRGLGRVVCTPVLAYRCRRRKGSLSSDRTSLMIYRRKALRAYCRYYMNQPVEDLEYVGRSPVTGAQHFRILTPGGAVRPKYEQDLLPSLAAAAQEAPVFIAGVKDLRRRSVSVMRRLEPGLAAVGASAGMLRAGDDPR